MMTLSQPASKIDPQKDPRPHAIVIGAGFGGLAAGVRLGARGYRVTIIDRLEGPGGRGCAYEQDGFTFDAGPTIITAPFTFEELWALNGEKMNDHVTLAPMSPCYTVRFHDGSEFRCFSDHALMREEIKRFSPNDLDGYEKFLKESERCFQAGFEKMIDEPFHSAWRMVKAMPDLIMRRAERSVHSLVSKYVKDWRLRRALSFHPLFIGGNPMRSSGVMSLISFMEQKWGVHYAMGGTAMLAEGLAALIKRQGGTLIFQATVDEILVDNNRAAGVRLASGEVLKSDIVVSNADTAWTYDKLLKKQPKKRWTPRKIAKAKYSMSLFVWYFGTDKKFDNVDHHTIMMGERYQSLLADIFDKKHLADDFSLYLHRPTKTDPSMAPDGCEAFYVLSPVPNLDGGQKWDDALIKSYRAKIAAYLDETIMPGFEKHIVTEKIVTPETFVQRFQSTKGAAFGMEPTLFQLAWFRPHNKSEELDGLYIVGAGTHPGAGVPAVVSSAKVLDKIVPHGSTVKSRVSAN